MNADGSHVTRISQGTDWGEYPDWSPDGTKIAYMSTFFDASGQNSDIFVMDADGSHIGRLTDRPGEDGCPLWSPDGKEIVWGRGGSEPTDPGLYIMNADGSAQRQLTDHDFRAASANWSPDGTKLIVGIDNRRGQEKGIWLMNPDGSGRLQLRDHGSQPAWRPPGAGKKVTHPALNRTVFFSHGVSIEMRAIVTSDGSPLVGIPVAVCRLGAPSGTVIVGHERTDGLGRFRIRLHVGSARTWSRTASREALLHGWRAVSVSVLGDDRRWGAAAFVAAGLPRGTKR